MPRLFAALEIPSDVAAELALLQGGVPGARWIDHGNYHITLRFIGDASGRQAQELFHLLEGITFPPFDIQLNGLGSFGSRKPRAIFARVMPSDVLNQLQFMLERTCQNAGLKPEQRKFTPHVTIARLRGAEDSAVNQFVAAKNLFHSRPFTVSRFVMMSSRPSRGGGPYALEQTYEADLAM